MTEEEHDAKLRAEAQALREEVEKAQNALAFTEQWHGVRYERLWHWAHAELDEEQKRRYFNIVANGTAEHSEPPTYAQQLCRMKHRYECAEKEAAALRARVAVVPDGYALVPVEPTREMFIAINKEDDKAYAGGCHHGAQFEWLWDAAIEAAPRPNSLTVSEGLLREARRHLGNWLELHECECEGGFHYCGREQVAKTHRELRALLGEEKEHE
ncbi:hypothetical protein [Pseudomonas aeruginosa]|uniref:hypothetical protein n=1 Tax=Pseudomonas aeruginosa TaxID=287 RepID=UPI0021F18C25|nr:hypothetical protein [Pseudomonas aeruginosa]MCV6542047.1 hypothetical protein [Pseudomonas aeruginosa]